MKKIVSFFLCFMCIGANADPASGAAQAAQLAELVRQAKEQLVEVRKQLSVMENLKEMEQMKMIKELTETGDALGQMFSDMRSMENTIADWQADPAGTRQIENDIDRLTRSYEDAQNERGINQGAAYADMLSGLSRMKWLGKAQAKNLETMAGGISPTDAATICADTNAIIADVLLETEKARRRREVIGTEIFMDAMNNVDYGNMGLLK